MFKILARSAGGVNSPTGLTTDSPFELRPLMLIEPVWCALRPEVMKHDGSNNNAENDSRQAVPDLVEFCIGREALKDAHEKGEGNLQASIRNPFTAGGD